MRGHTMVRPFGIVAAALLAGAVVALGPPGVTWADAPEGAPEALTLSPDTGSVVGGEVVTVTGSGFVAGETWVRFDGAYLDATVQSSTSLTFVTPAHAAGPAEVFVIVQEAWSAGSLTFTVGQQAAPPAIIEPVPSPTASPARPGRARPSPSVTPGRQGDRPVPIRAEPPSTGEPPTLAATGAGAATATGVLGLVLIAAGAGLRVAGRRPDRG